MKEKSNKRTNNGKEVIITKWDYFLKINTSIRPLYIRLKQLWMGEVENGKSYLSNVGLMAQHHSH